MELDIYQIDAFTNEQFKGNPAAVVPLQNWLSDELLLKIAMENNLSETAYFIPVEGPDADFFIRWFTPKIEVDLCGHATLASAAVIFRELGWDKDVIRLESKEAGLLTVRRNGDRIILDFPTRTAFPVERPDGLSDALGLEPVEFRRASKNLAVLENWHQVRDLTPDLDFIAGMEGDGLVVTAAGENCDCESRYFAPHAGIPEDPVTGSAHCTVIPYWAERLEKKEIHARQMSERGGDLYCRLEGERTLIAGEATLYMKGQIFL